MTFLNPLVLFGLAAAAIPVILHLLNLRKLRTIDFSTLTFLKELQQSKIRRLKLRQILLLIIRTLMVVFIVLAFARPALKGSFPVALGGRAGSTVAIVLDDSFSMMFADEKGERFTQAKDAARNVISLLKEGDAAVLVKLSELPRVTVEPATHDFGLLATLIDRSQTSPIRRTLPEGIDAAVRLLGESKDVNREIYVISDFQKTALLRRASQGAEAAGPGGGGAGSVVPGTSGMNLPDETGETVPEGTDAPVTAPGVNLFLVPVGSRSPGNASVDSVDVLSGIFEKNKPVALSATIRNHGDTPLRDAVVSVFSGETRVAQTNVSVEPGSSRSLDLTFVPAGSAFIGGRVELETDELDADNRRYFSFYVPDRIRVLVAGGSADDVRFVLPALRAAGGGEGGSVIDVTSIAAAAFPRTSIVGYDVLVLCGIPTFTPADAGRIGDFVKEGGGLILFPGDGSDAAGYNSALLGPLSLPVIRGATETGGDIPGLYFREVDFDHPLFASVFEGETPERDAKRLSPGISRALDFGPTPLSRPVITLSNGNGFLIDQPAGRGRTLIFASAPLLGWGDFPMKGLFAPLIHRSVMYLAADRDRPRGFLAGDEGSVTVRMTATGEAGSQFGLRFPDGVEEFIMPAASPSGLLFRYPSLSQPGIYELKGNGTVVAAFPVNTDPLEADPARASDEAVDSVMAGAGFRPDRVSRLEAGDALPERITEARLGVELWKYCIVLVLLLALAEMIINRRARGEKTVEA